jgi:hypothetical protein
MSLLNVKAQDERMYGSVHAADATHKINTDKVPLIGWGLVDKVKKSHLTQLQVSEKETTEAFVHGKGMERDTAEQLVLMNQQLAEEKTAAEESMVADWKQEREGGGGVGNEYEWTDDEFTFILGQNQKNIEEAISKIELLTQNEGECDDKRFMLKCLGQCLQMRKKQENFDEVATPTGAFKLIVDYGMADNDDAIQGAFIEDEAQVQRLVSVHITYYMFDIR